MQRQRRAGPRARLPRGDGRVVRSRCSGRQSAGGRRRARRRMRLAHDMARPEVTRRSCGRRCRVAPTRSDLQTVASRIMPRAAVARHQPRRHRGRRADDQVGTRSGGPTSGTGPATRPATARPRAQPRPCASCGCKVEEALEQQVRGVVFAGQGRDLESLGVARATVTRVAGGPRRLDEDSSSRCVIVPAHPGAPAAVHGRRHAERATDARRRMLKYTREQWSVATALDGRARCSAGDGQRVARLERHERLPRSSRGRSCSRLIGRSRVGVHAVPPTPRPPPARRVARPVGGPSVRRARARTTRRGLLRPAGARSPGAGCTARS